MNFKVLSNMTTNCIFFLSCFLSAIVCYIFFGEIGVVFGVITTLNTKVIFDAGENNAFLLSWTLSIIILIGFFLGYLFKLTIEFYLYILIISFIYYYFYSKNPNIDQQCLFL